MSNKSKKTLVVVSVDGMNKIDFELLSEKEPFKSFIEEGAFSDNVLSVYPTLSYPALASMMTSCHPDKHGIINNFKNDKKNIVNPDWYWFKKDLKVKTLYDYLEEKNYKNSSFFFPSTTGEKRGIVVPEIWSTTGKSFKKELNKNLSFKMKLSIMSSSKLLDELNQPNLDNFSFDYCKKILKSKKPDTIFLRFTELSRARESFGLKGPHIEIAYDSICAKLIELELLLKKNSKYSDVHFAILGTNGGMNTLNDVNLNAYFKENGLLSINEGKILPDTKVYANSSGASSFIIIREKKFKSLVLELLLLLRDKGVIKDIFSRQEAYQKYNLDGEFDYIVEAMPNHRFTNEYDCEVITNYNYDEKSNYVYDSGQLPQYDLLRSLFFIKGPKIKKNYYLEFCSLVDEGVTFARLMDVYMPNTDGRILEEIIKK